MGKSSCGKKIYPQNAFSVIMARAGGIVMVGRFGFLRFASPHTPTHISPLPPPICVGERKRKRHDMNPIHPSGVMSLFRYLLAGRIALVQFFPVRFAFIRSGLAHFALVLSTLVRPASIRPALGRAIGGIGVLILSVGMVACSSDYAQNHQDDTDVRMSRIAKRMYDAGDHAGAANFYAKVLDKNRADIPALYGLGMSLLKMGKPVQAEDTFHALLAIDPGHNDGIYYLAKAYLAQEKTEDAVRRFGQLLAADPQDSRALNGIGMAYDLAGRHRDAQKAYISGLRVSEDNPLIYNNLGLSLALDGNLDAAIDVLGKIGTGPKSTRKTRQNLAMLHAFNGDMSKAEEISRIDLNKNEMKRHLAFFKQIRTTWMKNGNRHAPPDAPSNLSPPSQDDSYQDVIDDRRINDGHINDRHGSHRSNMTPVASSPPIPTPIPTPIDGYASTIREEKPVSPRLSGQKSVLTSRQNPGKTHAGPIARQPLKTHAAAPHSTRAARATRVEPLAPPRMAPPRMKPDHRQRANARKTPQAAPAGAKIKPVNNAAPIATSRIPSRQSAVVPARADPGGQERPRPSIRAPIKNTAKKAIAPNKDHRAKPGHKKPRHDMARRTAIQKYGDLQKYGGRPRSDGAKKHRRRHDQKTLAPPKSFPTNMQKNTRANGKKSPKSLAYTHKGYAKKAAHHPSGASGASGGTSAVPMDTRKRINIGAQPPRCTIQIGSYLHMGSLDNARQSLHKAGFTPRVTRAHAGGKKWHVLRTGNYADCDLAKVIADRLRAKRIATDATVRVLKGS